MKKQLLTLAIAFLCFVSCGKKEDPKPDYSIDKTTVSIHYDEDHQFDVKQGPEDISEASLTWTSSDQSVGTISTSGLFKAKKVGTTTIKGTGGGYTVQSEITVTPYSNLCKEPISEFGANKASIKGKESRQLSGETSTALLYNGENSKVRNVMYVFENSGMTGALLLLSSSNIVVEESVQFLKERYTFVGESDDFFIFTDGKTVDIGVTVDATLGFVAIYTKHSASTSIAKTATTNSVIEPMESAFKEKLRQASSAHPGK